MGSGNRPTPEIRSKAVRMALISGRTRREIAEDLRLCCTNRLMAEVPLSPGRLIPRPL